MGEICEFHIIDKKCNKFFGQRNFFFSFLNCNSSPVLSNLGIVTPYELFLNKESLILNFLGKRIRKSGCIANFNHH